MRWPSSCAITSVWDIPFGKSTVVRIVLAGWSVLCLLDEKSPWVKRSLHYELHCGCFCWYQLLRETVVDRSAIYHRLYVNKVHTINKCRPFSRACKVHYIHMCVCISMGNSRSWHLAISPPAGDQTQMSPAFKLIYSLIRVLMIYLDVVRFRF